MNFKKITLYGSGLIGTGWLTQLLICDGFDVTVYDIKEDILEKCRKNTLNNLSLFVKEGVFSEEEAENRLNKVHFTTDKTKALEEADFIQENVPENLELKHSVLADIESVCRPDAAICSSTSALDLGEIVADAVHPERVVAGHPYHPVYLLPLIEMIPCEKTDPKYIRAVYDFYKSIRKEPVVLKKSCPGYIGTRLMTTLYRECVHMVTDGVCTMEDIETAFCYGPGMRYALLGPNTVLQLAGGEHGLIGVLLGGMGDSGSNTMATLANWTVYPEETYPYFEHCQEEMDKVLANRDDLHGHNNDEIAAFRDRGLIQLLKQHGKL